MTLSRICKIGLIEVTCIYVRCHERNKEIAGWWCLPCRVGRQGLMYQSLDEIVHDDWWVYWLPVATTNPLSCPCSLGYTRLFKISYKQFKCKWCLHCSWLHGNYRQPSCNTYVSVAIYYQGWGQYARILKELRIMLE